MEYRTIKWLCADLTGQLKRLNSAYGELYALGEKKLGALRSNAAVDVLREITEQEQKYVAEASKLEAERRKTTEEIRIACGAETENFSVTDIYAYAQEQDAKPLRTEAERLLACLLQIKEQNELNRELVEMKMSYNSYLLNVFASEQPVSSTYSSSGQESDYGSSTSRLLDSEI